LARMCAMALVLFDIALCVCSCEQVRAGGGIQRGAEASSRTRQELADTLHSKSITQAVCEACLQLLKSCLDLN